MAADDSPLPGAPRLVNLDLSECKNARVGSRIASSRKARHHSGPGNEPARKTELACAPTRGVPGAGNRDNGRRRGVRGSDAAVTVTVPRGGRCHGGAGAFGT